MHTSSKNDKPKGKGKKMEKTALRWMMVTAFLLVLSGCSSDSEESVTSLPSVEESEATDFLDDAAEDLFKDELDKDAIISSKVNAPVDFKEWISAVEMSTILLKKDGYSLEMPNDLVVYDASTTNKLVLSQNIPLETDAYKVPNTLSIHGITIVRGDAGILETKKMVYNQQLQLEQLAEEQQITQKELVFIHDFKEFDNKYGETFQYTMIETMHYSEEFPTSLILILAQEKGHLYFDASYENDQQKEALKDYLLELCYHISTSGEGFLADSSSAEGEFYQLLEDGSHQKIEVTTGQEVAIIDLI